MGKIAYIFPGQGSQYVGMGYDFYREFSEASDVFHSAEVALRYNLTDIIFKGPEDELNKTINTQPALLTVSLAIYAVLKANGLPKADFVAGHSLGEYTALAVVGGVELFEAVRLAYLRGKYMQEAVPEGVGAMVAVLKLSPEKVEEACRLASDVGVVEPANYNSPEQVVISGERQAVEKASQIVKEMGGKVISLKVSVPSHCSLMKPAADAFRLKLAQTPIKNIDLPLVQNYTAKAHTMAHEIRENLYRQIFSSVRWYQSLQYMAEQGVDTFVEIGPKNVLSKLVVQTLPHARVMNVEKVEDVEKVIKALR
ncbi:malonyl CoA-acyl carrier protein transacylase [Hydrogenobacter thermophilus TK-6]|uniref:Malonyl CoA-acyl carrier protein transacylase n=1 Tax=Hydrogenobacter thermophilus (strain DSM 6534 / IAM 12695 / TK-6) TaxID=608538 RepID=D3DGI6_HYDTT|nr:ACP S-malonyltransferase [Hydrogenobacter thermophilus]ADO44873.1 malonyl CoA-acyl carrier protein transacylase [Hydrogenobacter thermophilus TK-6]BAI68938.1 malonyl CoA-acyl carrier protein transacylase [Hydrogenobacter thermophilus TK-6]